MISPTTNTMLTIDVSRVQQVYCGKANTCCCGCAGRYNENPRRIKQVVRHIEMLAREGNQVIVDDEFVSVQTKARMYTAYYCK